MQSTPASLIVRLRRSGDAGDWRRFVLLFTPLLDRWAGKLGLQDADAADVLQDVFHALVRRLPEFDYDRDRSFRAWLWTVLHHAAFRRQRVREPQSVPSELLDQSIAPPEPGVDEEEYRRHLVGRAVQIMQADFAPATWQACWGTVVEGRPAAEVAARLGLSVNAVYLARARVLNRLRQELAGLLE